MNVAFDRVLELWFENRVVFWVCEFWNYDLSVENLFGYGFWIECWIEFWIECGIEFWKLDLTCEVRKFVWLWVLERVFKT